MFTVGYLGFWGSVSGGAPCQSPWRLQFAFSFQDLGWKWSWFLLCVWFGFPARAGQLQATLSCFFGFLATLLRTFDDYVYLFLAIAFPFARLLTICYGFSYRLFLLRYI